MSISPRRTSALRKASSPRFKYEPLKKPSPKSPSKVHIRPININIKPQKFTEKALSSEVFLNEKLKNEAKLLLFDPDNKPDLRSARRKAEEAEWEKLAKDRDKMITKIRDKRDNLLETTEGFIGNMAERKAAAVAHIAQTKKERLKGMSLTGKRKRLGKWIKKQFTRGGRKRGNKRKTMRK